MKSMAVRPIQRPRVANFVKSGVPLLRISHLLAFIPRSAGNWSRSSSNNSFISFRRLRSASLCDTRNSGEREYGVEPAGLSEDVWADVDPSSRFALPPDIPALLVADWSAVRTREGGRERDLRLRVGPVEGGVGRGSGEILGADIRRSGAKVTGGMIVVSGSKGG